jgi:hypothetical protein
MKNTILAIFLIAVSVYVVAGPQVSAAQETEKHDGQDGNGTTGTLKVDFRGVNSCPSDNLNVWREAFKKAKPLDPSQFDSEFIIFASDFRTSSQRYPHALVILDFRSVIPYANWFIYRSHNQQFNSLRSFARNVSRQVQPSDLKSWWQVFNYEHCLLGKSNPPRSPDGNCLWTPRGRNVFKLNTEETCRCFLSSNPPQAEMYSIQPEASTEMDEPLAVVYQQSGPFDKKFRAEFRVLNNEIIMQISRCETKLSDCRFQSSWEVRGYATTNMEEDLVLP